jgi:SAM-dependent methyltransferase
VSELQHPDSQGFELVADIYERARPGYPHEAVAWLAEQLELGEGRTVLDLGAGTGKLTRSLIETGARVIAVEPGDAMRAELERAAPAAEALRGSAEHIPLPAASVDAITIGQAFHWFRPGEAIPELARVLREGGRVAVLWNARDQKDPLQQRVSDLISPFVPAGRPGPQDWRLDVVAGPLAENARFGPLEERRFHFEQRLDADGLTDRIASMSFVASAPEAERRALEVELRALVEQHGGWVDFRYVTWVFVSRAG